MYVAPCLLFYNFIPSMVIKRMKKSYKNDELIWLMSIITDRFFFCLFLFQFIGVGEDNKTWMKWLTWYDFIGLTKRILIQLYIDDWEVNWFSSVLYYTFTKWNYNCKLNNVSTPTRKKERKKKIKFLLIIREVIICIFL